MSVFMGDFLGFRLGKEHSYNLNITRTSTSDRYNDGLSPIFNDRTSEVPGGDGTYYWGSNYTQKNFQVDFAFDNLSDYDLRRLRHMFTFTGLKELVFDEFPYKKYMVKCSQPPVLSYICFDNYETGGRIYKGTGQAQFIAYYPFALGISVPKLAYKPDGVELKNQGDLPAYLQIVYPIKNILNGAKIYLTSVEDDEIREIKIGNIEKQNNDEYISFNFETQLIEGLDKNLKKTGTLYNLAIESGDFFTIPVGASKLYSTTQYYSAQYTTIYY